MSLEDQAKDLFLKEIDEIVSETGEPRDLAFTRWICQNIIGIVDDAKIDEAISIGGKNDYDVDIFHHEDTGTRTDDYVCWSQAKFSDTLDRVVTRQEMESFGRTIGYLESCPSQANITFKQKSVEFNSLGGVEAPIRKRMIFAVTGKLNSQALELINSQQWKQQVIDTLNDPKIDFEVIDLEKILSYIKSPTTQTLRIKFDSSVLTRTDTTNQKNSIVGYVKAKEIVEIVQKYKETLFLENPRQTLGRLTPTYLGISKTLKDSVLKLKFWKLNNGITAICTSLNEITSNPAEYEIQNFKVVNGRQTTFTLEENPSDLDGVTLSMIIHEAVDDKERNLISETTNTQNPVKPVDLITNFPELHNLVIQCKRDYDNFYFERQTKGFKAEPKPTQKRVTHRRVLEKNATARAYYAYAINPAESLMPDKDLFSSINTMYYDRVFKNRKIKDLLVPHIFMQMLKALYAKWSKELKSDPPIEIHARDKDILSKDIVKYFILHFISHTMKNIPDYEKNQIEDKIIEIFRKLLHSDPIPDDFINIARVSYDNFMKCFDLDRNNTWPQEILDRLSQPGYSPTPDDKPNGIEIMYKLKKQGQILLPEFIRSKDYLVTSTTIDGIKLKLLRLISTTPSP